MFRSIWKWFYHWLHLGPHFVVGDPKSPYLLRWYAIPRNPLFNIYIHKFLRDDDDRALHDHPWASLSILLWGRYLEQCVGKTILGDVVIGKWMRSWKWFFKGMGGFPIIYRSSFHAHRVELIDNKPAWTLFITGPRVREWGFHCPKGWISWKDFVKPGAEGEVGKGCGET